MRFRCLASFCIVATLASQAAAEAVAPSSPQVDTMHEVPRVALLLDPTLCDGFDFPVGDLNGKGAYRDRATRRYHQGWLVTAEKSVAAGSVNNTWEGEIWNGRGGGSTDAAQPVYAIGAGIVRSIVESPSGAVIEIEHRYLENAKLQTMRSRYSGISEVKVKEGDTVKRRQPLGVIAKGEGETRTQLILAVQSQHRPAAAFPPTTAALPPSPAPSAFIRERRKLLVPAREAEIFIAMKRDYRLYLFRKGKLVRFFPIALSQDPLGPKTREGDNRTPEGEYRVTQKAKGPFDGEYGQFLGQAWIRISYPNAHDARAALAEGRITTGQCSAIVSAIESRKMPPAKTSLGGGVGIHGWASDWPDGPQDLTWGCLSLRHADLMALYELMAHGSVLIIHP